MPASAGSLPGLGSKSQLHSTHTFSLPPSVPRCCGWNSIPKAMCLSSLMVPVKVTLSRDRVLADGQVKMRSLGWTLIQSD